MKNKQAEQKAAKLRHKEQFKAMRRTEPDINRPVANLDVKPTLLIVCEGKNTEPSYFNQFRLSSAKIKPIGEGFNTVSLVGRAIELSTQGTYEQVWCVFDKDDFSDSDFNDALKLASDNGINVAYSNQSFEYWLILHFDDHQGGGMHRNNYDQKINKLLAPFNVKYDGKRSKVVCEDFFELLDGIDDKTGKERIQLAIKRAEKIYSFFDHKNPAKEESSTTVFLLAKELIKYR